MAVTQRQIAVEANVSPSTVAAVMSEAQRGRITPEVQARVFAAAEKLGYRPNRHAQVMRGMKSNCIGILSFGATSSLVQRKLKAVTEAVLANDYRFIVEEALWYQTLGKEAIVRIIDNLIDARVEGVLLNYPVVSFSQELADRLLEAKIPVVSIARHGKLQIPQYISDRPWGYRAVTRHLLEGGYRRLLLLASPRSDGYEGYHEALADYPEAQRASRVLIPELPRERLLDYPADARVYAEGAIAAEQVLAQGDLPEAIVCSNDEWAVGALTTFTRAGLHVPRDLALTGFDNASCSAFGTVPITTVDHPITEIAVNAVNHLIRLVRGEVAPGTEAIRVQGRLLIRDSCGLGSGSAN